MTGSTLTTVRCPYPGCDEAGRDGGVACHDHEAAELERRARIARAKTGTPRSAETRAKLSAAKTGSRQVERGQHWLTLNELKRASGRGYKLLREWADSGDAPCVRVCRPGGQADVTLFYAPLALRLLGRVCEVPGCPRPTHAATPRCAAHPDPAEVKRAIVDLAAHAGVTRWWLTKLLHAVRPELHGEHRPLTPREIDALLAAQRRCRRRGCANPAGPGGACWLRGHHGWMRPRPLLQKFGHASREVPCAGGCGKTLLVRGYRVARGAGERCNACTVRHRWATDERWRARWYTRRHKSTKLWGATGGRPREYSVEQASKIRELAAAGKSQRAIARIVGVSRGTVRHLLAADEVG